MTRLKQTRSSWSPKAEYDYYNRHAGRAAGLDDAPIMRIRRGGYAAEKLQFGFFWPEGAARAVEGKVVLDLASGESFTGCSISELLPAAHVICVDAVVPQIFQTFQIWSTLRITRNITFAVGDAYHIPIRDAGVDIVIVSRAIHHFPQFYRVLFEIDRILTPGGSVIIAEPNDKSLLRFLTPHEGSENEGYVDTDAITRFFANLGYTVNTSYYWVRFPAVRIRWIATNYLLTAQKPGDGVADETTGNVAQLFQCPVTRQPLVFEGNVARTLDSHRAYPVCQGLPILLPEGSLRDLAQAALRDMPGSPAGE